MEKQDQFQETTNQSSDTYFRRGIEEASKKAKEYAPKFKKEVEGLLNDTAYGAGFLPSFVSTLAKEVLPSHLRLSVEKGSTAGAKAAQSFVTSLKQSQRSVQSPAQLPEPCVTEQQS